MQLAACPTLHDFIQTSTHWYDGAISFFILHSSITFLSNSGCSLDYPVRCALCLCSYGFDVDVHKFFILKLA